MAPELPPNRELIGPANTAADSARTNN